MTTDPAKRVPKSIGTDAKLFGSYTLTDLAVGLFPGVAVVLLTQLVLPPTASIAGYSVQTVALPLAIGAILVGGVFVYLTPSYTSSLDWFTAMLSFHNRTTEHGHEASKEYTQVERVHPDVGAIERTDGAFVGVIEVDPPMLALATDDEWAQKTDAFQEFLNTTVAFPVQFYSTTRSFPVDEYLGRYETRLEDPDVKANPELRALIENYIDWYQTELADRQMTIRDHYVIVPVTPAEVQFERESIVDQLASVPLLGRIVRILAAPPIAHQRAVLRDELDERRRRISNGLRDIDGCEATAVPATDAVSLLETYWTDTDNPGHEQARRLRTTPLIGDNT